MLQKWDSICRHVFCMVIYYKKIWEDWFMKKLFYVLTLVLLLAVVPVSTVEAKTTKPDKPTIEVKYSTSKDQWYARFNCKTKGATIKYRINGNYKSIKP